MEQDTHEVDMRYIAIEGHPAQNTCGHAHRSYCAALACAGRMSRACIRQRGGQTNGTWAHWEPAKIEDGKVRRFRGPADEEFWT